MCTEKLCVLPGDIFCSKQLIFLQICDTITMLRWHLTQDIGEVSKWSQRAALEMRLSAKQAHGFESHLLRHMESWLSGRRRTTGNRVYLIRVTRVQIPNSPPSDTQLNT